MQSNTIGPLAVLSPLALVALSAAPAYAQVYTLTREQAVRPVVNGVEARVDWIRDEPRSIDKQSFRNVDLTDVEGAHVYVRFLPGVDDLAMSDAHVFAGRAKRVWESQLVPNLFMVRIADYDLVDTIQRYLDHPSTLYAEPSRLSRVDNDPFWLNGSLYGMETGEGSNAEAAWEEHFGAQEFTIAVIDSGLYGTHEDIAPNLWVNTDEIPGNGIDDDGNGFIDDVNGWDFTDSDGDPTPVCQDHGQHVAGTIGAKAQNGVGVRGVNWVCRLMNLRCEFVDTQGCICLINTLLGFDYAVANGATVSNHSYGGTNFNQSVFDAILASQAMGHLFVTSAGNSYNNIEAIPNYPASYSLSNILSVANTDDDGELYEVCDLFGSNCGGSSSYGPISVDLGAPGTGIFSTSSAGAGLSFYSVKTGTSMAAPHVAGAVGLVRSKYPNIEWWKVRDRILTSTVDEPTLAGKCVTGGRLDVQRALGVWASPFGTSPYLSSKNQPLPYDSGPAFATGVVQTPTYGHLNLFAGTVKKSDVEFAVDFGFGTQPMTITATGGVVRLGG